MNDSFGDPRNVKEPSPKANIFETIIDPAEEIEMDRIARKYSDPMQAFVSPKSNRNRTSYQPVFNPRKIVEQDFNIEQIKASIETAMLDQTRTSQ